MEKITLSLHNVLLKKRAKITDYNLPGELDSLLDGIEVYDEVQKKDYKSLRDGMYASI